MSYITFIIPFTILFIASIFYYIGRFYLAKYKDLQLPLIPERYHDDLYLTLIQAIVTIIGLIIGYGVVIILF